MLVFCSTKKWCQQTAGLLAKEVLSDRNRAAARESAGTAVATAAAAASSAKKRYGHRAGSGFRGVEGAVALADFVPARSVAPHAAAVGAAAAKNTESFSTVSAIPKQQGPGAATATTKKKESDPHEGRRTASVATEPPSAADAVREKLRQTPVGLDAELSYLVRRGFDCVARGSSSFVSS